MIRKKPAPDLIRSGNRFSEKIMLEHNVRGDDDSKKHHPARGHRRGGHADRPLSSRGLWN